MKSNDKIYLLFTLLIIPGISWLTVLSLWSFNCLLSDIGEGFPFFRHCLIFAIFSSVIAIIIYVIVVKQWNKKEKELQEAILCSDISQIDNLSPYEFEEWVARFLRIAGYKAEATKRSGDYGVDVIAEKDYIKLGVQVKKFTKPVGIKAVQEIISGMYYYNCNEGWVVTTAPYFTTAAINLAKTQNIKLYTKNDIALMLKNLQSDENITNEEQIRYCNQCRFQLFPEDKICPNCKNKDFNEPKSNEDNEFL